MMTADRPRGSTFYTEQERLSVWESLQIGWAMSTANVFQLIGGLCFATLTVWKPFMRSDSRGHRLWHTVIGIAGMAALVVATVLNSSMQTQYADALNRLATSVQKLAGPAKAEANSTVDQILAAAASKLIQQDKEIRRLNDNVNAIQHPADGLYFGDAMVGRVMGNISKNGNHIVFQLVVAGSVGLDFSRTLTFQNLSIKCKRPSLIGESGSFGVMQMRYPNVHCEIVN